MVRFMRKFLRRLFAHRAAKEGREPVRHTVVGEPAPKIEAADAPKPVSASAVEEAFHRFVLGVRVTTDDGLSTSEQMTLRRLRHACDPERFDVSSLPRLPSVVPQLLRSLKNDRVTGAQLAEQIGHDPVLVGEIIRIANTPHYRTARPMTSLRQAIMLLGHDGLRKVVTHLVMRPILQIGEGTFGATAGSRLWSHAERCAHACAYLGKQTCDPFEAYLAGIVCNTGEIAIIRMLDQDPESVSSTHSTGFIAAYSRLGDELSLHAARHWQFPVGVLRALADRASPTVTALMSPLGRVLTTANRLAMVQALTEHGIMKADIATLDVRDERFPPELLARCQKDLQLAFAPEE
jgi:HD-like signal output (HDOD) protein